jgi:ATP-binding cassette subfamily B protein
LYNNFSAEEVSLDELRSQIGLVTQDTQLFSGSIRENLQFVAPGASDEECLDVLNKASLKSLLGRASHGLDTVIGEGGVKVSGGEKQRSVYCQSACCESPLCWYLMKPLLHWTP